MISHKHRCIFIHIPKCGGQSIEHIFLKENGLTWDTRVALLLRKNDDPLKGPPRLAHLRWQEYIDHGYVDIETMNTYTVFSVVRSPYKRVESFYRYLGFDASIPFDRFISDVLEEQLLKRGEHFWFMRPQYDYVSDSEGLNRVNNIIKLENINNELKVILEGLDIKDLTIPHINKSKKRGNLRSMRIRLKHAFGGIYSFSTEKDRRIEWNDFSREKVFSLYEKDFINFHYS